MLHQLAWAGGCAVRLSYDRTWTGGVLWGTVTFAIVTALLSAVSRRC